MKKLKPTRHCSSKLEASTMISALLPQPQFGRYFLLYQDVFLTDFASSDQQQY
jgi:hypothetical protein